MHNAPGTAVSFRGLAARDDTAALTKESRTMQLPCVIVYVNLYRIMVEVCAGPGQRNCQPGQRGLATVWVQSDTEENAILQARQIVASRQYQAVGELTAYLEHAHGSVSAGAGAEDPLAAGYTSIKEKALSSADGLFELWFPPK